MVILSSYHFVCHFFIVQMLLSPPAKTAIVLEDAQVLNRTQSTHTYRLPHSLIHSLTHSRPIHIPLTLPLSPTQSVTHLHHSLTDVHYISLAPSLLSHPSVLR